ncbi:MAG TPA: DUF1080 domain-containing protein [Chitinophagaceae bacterium]|nr:DUF1080 domain-containing protein [Chitinophagaceae bacterium]
MIKLLSSVTLLLLLTACGNDSDSDKTEGKDTLKATETTGASLSEQEKANGWQLLFDGQTTKGWHKYGGAPVGAAWGTADGAIYLDTSSKKDWQTANGGDIATDEEFENFDLKLEWKISPKGNSGIIFLVHEDTTKFEYSFNSGPEMQVVDNEGHDDGKIIKHQAGDLYDLISCSKKTVKPLGEWNEVEIKSVNGKLDLYLNGENVVSTTMGDDNWNKMIAKSKFKEWPGFGTFKKGRICLQDHGNMVWFRNIRVKKL